MKNRVIAGILILLLLLVPMVSGVFASPEEKTPEAAGTVETMEAGSDSQDEQLTTEETITPENTTIPEDTAATEPVETEPAAEPEPTEPAVTENPEPVTYSEFVVDTEPASGVPGREESHSNQDPTDVRYRYFWVVTLHITDSSEVSQKVYIQNETGGDVFTAERTTENAAYLMGLEVPELNGAEFGGWYTDPDCSDDCVYSLENSTITDHLKLYAKWIYPDGTLTIRRKVERGESQSFLYRVTGSDGTGIQVMIPVGKTEVILSGLKYDVTYTVAEDASWSWRYPGQSKTAKLTVENPSAIITFESAKAKDNWLEDLVQKIYTVRKG